VIEEEQQELKVLMGDCMKSMQSLKPKSVQCCVTSPPYFGLRDYGTGTWVGGDPDCPHRRTTKIGKTVPTITGHQAMHEHGNAVGDAIYKTKCPKCGAVREDKQIGLEETPEEFVDKLVEVFREVKRVLKDDGTLWLNIGDSYAIYSEGALKQKDLIGIPWRLAFALQADGWYLRQDIIWHKPNPMPESVQDRCTKSHEYIFLLSKSPKYYYDNEAIKENAETDPITRDKMGEGYQADYYKGKRFSEGERVWGSNKKNKRSVWQVALKPYKEAHFATYPADLIEPCILAGSKMGDTILDPFGGSGTTAGVALKHGRKAILCELNENYEDLIDARIRNIFPDIDQYAFFDKL
jgi:DNA modification methylase